MVVKFLNELRSEYLNEKIKLESEKNGFDVKLDENKKFIQKLKEEEKQNFNAFSPRNRNTNAHTKENIKNLEDENSELLEKSNDMQSKIETYESKLKEIDILLKDLKNESLKKKEKNSVFEEKKYTSELRNVYIQNLTKMIHRLEFCSKLVQIDPTRCKIELSSISKMIRGTIDEIYKTDFVSKEK